jgi:putative ABC transport system ATP-binding protein
MSDNPAVALQGICKTYTLGKTSIPALKDVCLSVERNEFLVIAGPSGSGKTTLLNIIGLIDSPSAGSLRFGGDELPAGKTKDSFRYRRDRLGYIFQTFNLIPVLNAYENVEYPLILSGIPKPERKTRVLDMLEKVGLLDRRKHKPRELSGGERQRVSIARAVVKNPDIVLADEPTANLDSRTGLAVLRLMERLNAEEGVAFVISSHDPMIVERGKRVIFLRDGAIEKMDGGGGVVL